jgi:dihydroflavonol-4-reductase
VDTQVDLSNLPVDASAPVMVTGATGYVAGWIVKGLVDAGVTVHAAVRDPRDTGRTMRGCRIVIHTASPFVRSVRDPQRDLVDPAVRGTHNVLGTATEVGEAQRVVLTSSVAAMIGDAQDIVDVPRRIVTEETWNTTSSPAHEPYSYSKTLAEKEAGESPGARITGAWPPSTRV